MEATESKSDERCVAHHYKPNIWSYDCLDTLVSHNNVTIFDAAKSKKLKQDFVLVLDQVKEDIPRKLDIIDNICKLGLSHVFRAEIMEAFHLIACNLETNTIDLIKDPHQIEASALCFRLLRQHGYNVSHGAIFGDGLEAAMNTTTLNIRGMIKLYEASHLVAEDDNLPSDKTTLLRKRLSGMRGTILDQSMARQVVDALGLPQHWRAGWFDVRPQIDAYESEGETGSRLLKLAKVNFSMVQAIHQQDLRDLSMWWRNLGLIEKIGFARDRLVESFVYALGIAPEPHYVSVRKCATKLINFILVIDDVYDVYGSVEELECFTGAVERWDLEETDGLPECMKTCFSALHDSTNDIVEEIQKDNGFKGAFPYIKKAWVDFCRSMLKEAQWEKQGYSPTLEEYLNNAWVSSSGSLLCLVVFLSAAKELNPQVLVNELEEMRNLIYYTSLIIRLCNDEATPSAEIKRGNSPCSILSYMRDANVTEEAARLKIKEIICNTWNKINGELLKLPPVKLSKATLILNAARVAHCFYNTGDGFGDQDGDFKRLIKHMLFESASFE